MANPNKSEVGFEVDGKAFTMKLSTNAICEIEDVTGKGINEFAEGLSDPQKFHLGDLRVFIYVCLMNGGSSVSRDEAGDLMDELGMARSVELVKKAFEVSKAFNLEDEDGGGKGKAAA